MKLVSPNLTNRVALEQSHPKLTEGYYHRFVMELLQWQNFYKIGEDEVLRPPVVALRILAIHDA